MYTFIYLQILQFDQFHLFIHICVYYTLYIYERIIFTRSIEYQLLLKQKQKQTKNG